MPPKWNWDWKDNPDTVRKQLEALEALETLDPMTQVCKSCGCNQWLEGCFCFENTATHPPQSRREEDRS